MDVYAAVKRHHELVAERGYKCLMTVLIGSQNYSLSDEHSDIDTFTFVFPSFEDMAFAREPKSGEFEVEDGKCMYKDIRLALNLLKKASPNSVECFIGQYRYFEPHYADVLKKYLWNDTYMNDMVHCNYSHMLYAIAGMSHQLTKRNMPAGKRYSHALRMSDMMDTYITTIDYRYLLDLLPLHRDEAYTAKRDTRQGVEEYYNQGCELIATRLERQRDEFILTPDKAEVEKRGMKLIEQFQKELFLKYIKTEVMNGN